MNLLRWILFPSAQKSSEPDSDCSHEQDLAEWDRQYHRETGKYLPWEQELYANAVQQSQSQLNTLLYGWSTQQQQQCYTPSQLQLQQQQQLQQGLLGPQSLFGSTFASLLAPGLRSLISDASQSRPTRPH
jgi:hypothetical protein